MRDLTENLLFYVRENFLIRWILASIFGWPIGFYAAALVVDIIGGFIGFLLGGLLIGSIAGGAQWLALRGLVEWDARRWIGMSAIGGCAGVVITLIVAVIGGILSFLILLSISSGLVIPLFILGAVFGSIIGLAQSTALKPLFGDASNWWILANVLAAALCGTFSFTTTLNWLPIFCSPGPLIFGMITGYALLRLFRTESDEEFFS